MSVGANYSDHANIFLGQKMPQMFVLYPALLAALPWKARLSKVAMNQSRMLEWQEKCTQTEVKPAFFMMTNRGRLPFCGNKVKKKERKGWQITNTCAVPDLIGTSFRLILHVLCWIIHSVTPTRAWAIQFVCRLHTAIDTVCIADSAVPSKDLSLRLVGLQM